MKKTLFKVVVYIFCVFSIVELCAEEGMEDLEKKNFFKIERLESEIIVLKDQYKLFTEQQRLNIEKKSESEEAQDLKSVITELTSGVYSALNTKINSLNKDILLLKNQYQLLEKAQATNTQEQSQSKGGLDLEVAFFKLNAKVNSLNDDILALKNQYELLTEKQRLNTQKITELFEIIELNTTKKEKTKKTIKTDKEKNAFKLYSNGKSQFALGDYEKATELFLSYLEIFPNSLNTEDSKLWLGRAYFASESYLDSKTAYVNFQSNGEFPHNKDHPKYADSLYELSRVLIKLNEINEAKLLLSNMIEEYPEHTLTKKATQLLQDL
jgi:TolA-binding protein